MDVLKTLLQPVSEKHSIKEAVITLFLSNPIVNPDRFKQLLEVPFKTKFQKFERVNQYKFNLKAQGSDISSSSTQLDENIGFRFVKYESSKAVVALQGINEALRSFISYHSLSYNRWNDFFQNFIEVITELSVYDPNLIVKAFSLHYIDEFYLPEGLNSTDSVFNNKSTLLPEDFFTCTLNNYLFTTVRKDKYEYLDRLEIKVEERPDVYVSISHNALRNISEECLLTDLIKQASLKEMLESAHYYNKKTLVNILREDVCKLINLKL